MGVPKTALFATHLNWVGKGSMDRVIYRKLALFSSCLFYITNYLLFGLRFIAVHVFRIKLDGSSRRDDSVKGLKPAPESPEPEERDSESDSSGEKETSSFSLKLEDSSDDSDVFAAMKDAEGLEPAPVAPEREGRNSDSSGEKVASSFSFRFQYQFSEDTMRSIGESVLLEENTPSATTDIRRYRFLSEKYLNGFVKEPEAAKLLLQESYLDGEKLNSGFTPRFLSAKDFQQPDNFSDFDKSDESKDVILLKDKLLEEEKPAVSSETNSLDGKEAMEGVRFQSEGFSGFDSDSESVSDGYSVKNLAVDSDSDGFLSEDDFGGFERELDTTEATMHSSRYEAELMEDVRKFDRQLQPSFNSDALSDDSGDGPPERGSNHSDIEDGLPPERGSNHSDIEDGLPPERGFLEPENKGEEKLPDSKGIQLPCTTFVPIEFTDSSDDHLSSFRTDSPRLSSPDYIFYVKDLAGAEPKPEDSNDLEARRISEIQCSKVDRDSDTEFDVLIGGLSAPPSSPDQADETMAGRDSDELSRKPEDLQSRRNAPETDPLKSEETRFEDLESSDDLYELESLWEHQDLIEQLKMELKKAKAVGLPTILEESESPKTIDDLKPWRILENFLHEDLMDELHKFYKSYRERMRKFDILNYQKMYAIGILQLKDPLQSIVSQKQLISTVVSHLSQNFRPFCLRISNVDPSGKFLKELKSDLETVYVGQSCLSWEFLRWQYEKARGLPECDPYRSHQYNQVAGEFQQFQVITQRFIEDESFQGPRLPNYVKNRCVLRNLLQVPLIKEDCLEDTMEGQRKGGDAITSEMLEDIMEESIKIFWEFIKADKNEASVIFKGLFRARVELQDPSDYKLMVDVHAILLKKEKKLKDILRTGNCLVKKFKKPQEDRSNQNLFFSQIDLKLVSMVMKMSRITTDQLVWCHKKLSKITFAEGKVQREPSFFLFPC